MLQSDDWYARCRALEVLAIHARKGDARAMAAAEAHLNDPRMEVRIVARKAVNGASTDPPVALPPDEKEKQEAPPKGIFCGGCGESKEATFLHSTPEGPLCDQCQTSEKPPARPLEEVAATSGTLKPYDAGPLRSRACVDCGTMTLDKCLHGCLVEEWLPGHN